MAEANPYISVGIFILIGFALSSVLLILPMFLAKIKGDKNKLSPYECGVEVIDNARGKFDINFYLVAMIFVIFDIEMCILMPWVVTIKKLGIGAFVVAMSFIAILIAGFVYEWKKGVIDW